ncbi:hypothetical protein BTA51_05105 [Hahella sp. CCB-MM4]|uniref:hypothetical protein n=1 Tax=Hahella sp. (strain CCB-MM4) TaxID=1926491 RepID=UPI000B9B7957|nr:hypothetical protein [Hahella sp. CCB-MM4]OZG74390.1 hypothetical protein BTA51_05105 [Hahella sp. CCB-MM4]
MHAGDERRMIHNLGRLLSLCLKRLQQLESELLAVQREFAQCEERLQSATRKLKEWQQSRSALLAKWEIFTGEAPDSHLAQKRSAYIDSVNDQVRYQQQEVNEALNARDATGVRLQEAKIRLSRQSARKDQLEGRIKELKLQLNKRQVRRGDSLVEERYSRSWKI